MWWVKVSTCPGELRAPCGGSPCVPTDNVDGASRTDRDPWQHPWGMRTFSENSKEPPAPWHGCVGAVPPAPVLQHRKGGCFTLCPAKAAPTGPIGNQLQPTHLCLQSFCG